MTAFSAYGVLIVSAFLSATLLPGSSEAVLLSLLAAGQGQPTLLVLAASLGNVAGATVNWLLGRFFSEYENSGWYPVRRDAARRAGLWFNRYGIWSLLFSWVPVVGDPLTLVAGVLRIDFWRFLLFVSAGKVLRYMLIVFVWQQWPAG